jgi:hypothetical protein
VHGFFQQRQGDFEALHPLQVRLKHLPWHLVVVKSESLSYRFQQYLK